jgi:hypothetical protein
MHCQNLLIFNTTDKAMEILNNWQYDVLKRFENGLFLCGKIKILGFVRISLNLRGADCKTIK